MMVLSIINDFCSWWLFWWVVPFLLGLLLGAALWRKYKNRIGEIEDILRRERNHNHELQRNLMISKNESTSLNNRISDLESSNKSLSKELATKTKSTIASTNIISNTSPKVVATPVSNQKPEFNYKKIKPTNLQIVEGIGPKMETLLNENGIKKWDDLSNKSVGELRAILDMYGGRYDIVNPLQWPEQARLASSKQWDKLVAFQSEDGSASKFEKILMKLGAK